jgi:signal transduction histidine kinase
VAKQFETMASIKRLQLIVSAPEAVIVTVEPEELRLLCSNLVLNAMQHGPAGSEVRAVVRRQGLMAELCIEDHGTGIAPEALPHVFDRFYRGDQSRSRETGGTGLGLAICKAIVTRAGGEIHLASVVDRGTTATVHLPLEPA